MTRTVVLAGKFIDGMEGEARENVAMVVEGSQVTMVLQAEQFEILPDDRVVDASEKTVMPGLIDAHVHAMASSWNIEEMLMTRPTVAVFRAARNLRRTLASGFTTLRCCGGSDPGLREVLESGLLTGPRLKTSGLLTQTGGHSETYFPLGVAVDIEPGNRDATYDGIDGVRIGARRRLREGHDFLKITTTGGFNSPQTVPTIPQYHPDEIRAIVYEADVQGKWVISHAHGGDGVKNALRCGVRSIEHGTFLDEEDIELFLKHNAFLVPTLTVGESMREKADEMGLAPYAREKSIRAGHAQRESMRLAIEGGVKIALGTDAASADMHGNSAQELVYMVDFGLTPMQAIIAGTRTAAEASQLGDVTGSLTPGKMADFLVVEGDPLVDISVLTDKSKIEAVYLEGELKAQWGQLVRDSATELNINWAE